MIYYLRVVVSVDNGFQPRIECVGHDLEAGADASHDEVGVVTLAPAGAHGLTRRESCQQQHHSCRQQPLSSKRCCCHLVGYIRRCLPSVATTTTAKSCGHLRLWGPNIAGNGWDHRHYVTYKIRQQTKFNYHEAGLKYISSWEKTAIFSVKGKKNQFFFV